MALYGFTLVVIVWRLGLVGLERPGSLVVSGVVGGVVVGGAILGFASRWFWCSAVWWVCAVSATIVLWKVAVVGVVFGWREPCFVVL